MRPSTGLFAAAIVLGAGDIAACPCRGSAGPSAPLTGAMEHWGAAFTQSTEIVHGVWDPYGELHELGDDENNTLIDYSLLAAFRPLEPLELALQLSYAAQTVVAPGLSARSSGLGDTIARARHEIFDQPMPMLKSPLPGVAAAIALRIPTGDAEGESASGVASGTTGSVGSNAASTTLGAWELALGVELVKSLGVHWEAALYGEAAYRFATTRSGSSVSSGRGRWRSSALVTS